jgi:hypothetical protein
MVVPMMVLKFKPRIRLYSNSSSSSDGAVDKAQAMLSFWQQDWEEVGKRKRDLLRTNLRNAAKNDEPPAS